MVEMDAVERAQQLGAIITQLQCDNLDLQALVHPDTPLEQVAEWKRAMEDLVTQLEEIEKEAKKVTKETTQF